MWVPARRLDPEWLDRPDNPAAQAEEALGDIRFVNRWLGREGEIEKHREELSTDAALAWASHDPAGASVYMGASAAQVRAIRPAAEVLVEVCSQAESILQNRWKELRD